MSKAKSNRKHGCEPIMVWLPQPLKAMISETGLGLSGFFEAVTACEFMKRGKLNKITVREWIKDDLLRRETVARLEGEGLI